MAFDQTKERRVHSGPRLEKRLTAANVKRAGPGRHADGGGLYLVVDPSGARRWVCRIMHQGRRRDIGLGGVADVSLTEAREEAARLRKLARQGIDPLAERRRLKHAATTFEEVARKVHAENIETVNRNMKANAQWLSSLETYAFPLIGGKSVGMIDQADVLRVLGPIWIEKPETARRVRQRLRMVFDWTRAHGLREAPNPLEGVETALPRQPRAVRHHPAMPYRDLPAFWKRLDDIKEASVLALKFLILTGVRSGEARRARWDQIDLEEAVWRAPAEIMKTHQPHRVPLSGAAIEVLRQAQDLAPRPNEALVFPGRKAGSMLSDNTLGKTLSRFGMASDYATVHGFRSTFRDWAEETTSYAYEVKEAALAHMVKSATERAYRRTDHFEQRKRLMSDWAAFVTDNR